MHNAEIISIKSILLYTHEKHCCCYYIIMNILNSVQNLHNITRGIQQRIRRTRFLQYVHDDGNHFITTVSKY